jgi:membrane protein YdbS with pleckstrin-like domain
VGGQTTRSKRAAAKRKNHSTRRRRHGLSLTEWDLLTVLRLCLLLVPVVLGLILLVVLGLVVILGLVVVLIAVLVLVLVLILILHGYDPFSVRWAVYSVSRGTVTVWTENGIFMQDGKNQFRIMELYSI